MWNLVAGETREGEVFKRLLEKLAIQRDALGGQVFDVLGQVFSERSLRELLLEAVRYGDRPDIRAKLAGVGNVPTPTTPEEMLDHIARDAARWSRVVEVKKIERY